MDNINNFMRRDPRYKSLSKPLQAANVCDTARLLADGRYDVISFKDGLLTLGSSSSSSAANLRMETYNIQNKLNEKLGQELVKKIRIKIN